MNRTMIHAATRDNMSGSLSLTKSNCCQRLGAQVAMSRTCQYGHALAQEVMGVIILLQDVLPGGTGPTSIQLQLVVKVAHLGCN